MARPFSERFDPWLLAEREAVVEGRVALSKLPRLAPLLSETLGEASYQFRFGRDDQGRHIIRSLVRAELRLTCQRCLESLSYPVHAAGSLALVQGPMEAEQLPGELDPLLVGAQELLRIQDLVEDELLLSIPVSPRHAAGVCSHQAEESVPELEKGNEAALNDNPFAVLAGLKKGSTHS